MQVKLISLISIICFFSGCVTFNDIEFNSSYQGGAAQCIDVSIKKVVRNFAGSEVGYDDLDYGLYVKTKRVLKNLKIYTDCPKPEKTYEIIVNNKAGNIKEILVGAWSVVTVLSLTIIPTYTSNEVELVVNENGKQIAKVSHIYSAAVWLPFIFKQWKDDSKAISLYESDAQSSVLGVEIAKILHSQDLVEKKSK